MSRSDRAITSMSKEDLDRFLDKVDFSGECWNWKASKNKDGYGWFGVKGRVVLAHRISCWLAHGPPPDEKPTADHLCKDRSCVNPEHLRWASRLEQCENMVGVRNLVDDDTAIECIKRCLSGESQSEVAKELGVSNQSIYTWVHGKRRSELLERARKELAA
jgi:hypothetical protein